MCMGLWVFEVLLPEVTTIEAIALSLSDLYVEQSWIHGLCTGPPMVTVDASVIQLSELQVEVSRIQGMCVGKVAVRLELLQIQVTLCEPLRY